MPFLVTMAVANRHYYWPYFARFLVLYHPTCVVQYHPLSAHVYRMLIGVLAIRCCARFPTVVSAAESSRRARRARPRLGRVLVRQLRHYFRTISLTFLSCTRPTALHTPRDVLYVGSILVGCFRYDATTNSRFS